MTTAAPITHTYWTIATDDLSPAQKNVIDLLGYIENLFVNTMGHGYVQVRQKTRCNIINETDFEDKLN